MRVTEYYNGLIKNNRAILGKAITLIESSLKSDINKKDLLISKCLPHSGKSIRIGISGTPGVGKSTFINKLGELLIQSNQKIAILAIDPSSSISKGSILGDKTRMPKLSNHKNVFIRPSPSKESLGGICESTKDSIVLCETAGYNIIIVETVGVGQSEILVDSITDIFIFLTLVDNGDEIQFIKKGVLELSDIIIINKCDQNIQKAKYTKLILEQNIKLSTHKKQTVSICSALKNTNIENIWSEISNLYKEKNKSGHIEAKRKQQNVFWLNHLINTEIQRKMKTSQTIQTLMHKLKKNQSGNTKQIIKQTINKLLK